MLLTTPERKNTDSETQRYIIRPDVTLEFKKCTFRIRARAISRPIPIVRDK